MAIDTPARIAVLGAGPIGLEAALYARYLGYEVELFERGQVADRVRRQGNAKLATCWRQCVTPLSYAALVAQDPSFVLPAADATPTGHEFVERYLLPLAHSDLLVDGLRLQHEVLGVARKGMQRDEHLGDELRRSQSLVVRVREPSGADRQFDFDAVIDATGLADAVAASDKAAVDGDRRGDYSFCSELPLRFSPTTGAVEIAADMTTAEPDFYVVGSKAVPSGEGFELSCGHDQIRRLFALIADRADLNLYATWPAPKFG
jgi:hypothetical protein